MRYMLNGQFNVNGVSYHRIDDTERMQKEEESGTYDPIVQLKQFDIAINAKYYNREQAQKIVDALNTL